MFNDGTKRICTLCGIDRTMVKPNGGGISQINDRRGDALGLFGECCYRAVLKAVDRSPRAYQWDERFHTREGARTVILQWARESKA
jgi:hypothetical protein